jgi:hypothetical protein
MVLIFLLIHMAYDLPGGGRTSSTSSSRFSFVQSLFGLKMAKDVDDKFVVLFPFASMR